MYVIYITDNTQIIYRSEYMIYNCGDNRSEAVVMDYSWGNKNVIIYLVVSG